MSMLATQTATQALTQMFHAIETIANQLPRNSENRTELLNTMSTIATCAEQNKMGRAVETAYLALKLVPPPEKNNKKHYNNNNNTTMFHPVPPREQLSNNYNNTVRAVG
jgi:hypothetical protein